MSIRVQDIIDALKAPGVLPEKTVDGLLSGSPETEVTGILTTFLATQAVIEKAKKLGANLIVSHEGIFFSHWGVRDYMPQVPTYTEKRRVIEESGMAIFRFHDLVHSYKPDMITQGMINELGWKNNKVSDDDSAFIVEIPPMTLRELAEHAKKCTNASYVRFTGNPDMPCRRIGLLPGFGGTGDSAIPFFEKQNLDAVLCGEGFEWETPEYVRDSAHQGRNRGLVVLGHRESESYGMKDLAAWLEEKFPATPVHYYSDGPVFQLV